MATMRDFDPAQLTNPAVVIAFSGWNDAANAASDALRRVLENFDSVQIDSIDDERYFDFQITRPVLRRSADGPWISWPQLIIHHVPCPERDLIVVLGPEPSLLWRSFTTDLIDRLASYQPEVVILLGAMLSDTAHTRPLPVAMSTYHQELRSRLAIQDLNYEGPTGITGIVNQMLIGAGFPSASMWVSIPHYVGSSPSPKAQLALLERLEQVLEIKLQADQLSEEAAEWVNAVDALSQDNPEVADYIEQLEQAQDALDVSGVTADSLAAEFERYLRDLG